MRHKKTSVIDWKEVWGIQNGKGNKVHLPTIGEIKANTRFIVTEVPIATIDLTLVSRLTTFVKYDCFDDVIAVESLMDAYALGETVPPIVLCKNKEIIDGIHRLSAQLELGLTHVVAYVEI